MTSIITSGGSVQHLDFLPEKLKLVFKTAIELDQIKIVEQAAARQKYLCQGQSLNIFFPAGAKKSYIHKTHYLAWKLGCKGLYYLRTETTQRAENVAEKIKSDKLKDFIDQEDDSCVACEG